MSEKPPYLTRILAWYSRSGAPFGGRIYVAHLQRVWARDKGSSP